MSRIRILLAILILTRTEIFGEKPISESRGAVSSQFRPSQKPPHIDLVYQSVTLSAIVSRTGNWSINPTLDYLGRWLGVTGIFPKDVVVELCKQIGNNEPPILSIPTCPNSPEKVKEGVNDVMLEMYKLEMYKTDGKGPFVLRWREKQSGKVVAISNPFSITVRP